MKGPVFRSYVIALGLYLFDVIDRIASRYLRLTTKAYRFPPKLSHVSSPPMSPIADQGRPKYRLRPVPSCGHGAGFKMDVPVGKIEKANEIYLSSHFRRFQTPSLRTPSTPRIVRQTASRCLRRFSISSFWAGEKPGFSIPPGFSGASLAFR